LLIFSTRVASWLFHHTQPTLVFCTRTASWFCSSTQPTLDFFYNTHFLSTQPVHDFWHTRRVVTLSSIWSLLDCL
jgi:hypothetical protein